VYVLKILVYSALKKTIVAVIKVDDAWSLQCMHGCAYVVYAVQTDSVHCLHQLV